MDIVRKTLKFGLSGRRAARIAATGVVAATLLSLFSVPFSGARAQSDVLTVRGAVVSNTGQPVAGAFVAIGGTAIRADEQGRYQAQTTPAVQIEATAWAPGFVQQSLYFRSRGSGELSGVVSIDFSGQFALHSALANPSAGATLSGLPITMSAQVHVAHVRGVSRVPLEPVAAVTLPNGHVKSFPLRTANGTFTATVRFKSNGAYQIELSATSGLPVFNVTVFHGVAPFPPRSLIVPPDPTGATGPQLARFGLSLINRARSRAGLQPLSLQPNITAAAAAHTTDLARYGYFMSHPHIGSDGSTPFQRVHRFDPHIMAVGEAVAEGSTVGMIVQSLLNSPAHRAILLGHFRWVGVSVTSTGGLVLMTVDVAR